MTGESNSDAFADLGGGSGAGAATLPPRSPGGRTNMLPHEAWGAPASSDACRWCDRGWIHACTDAAGDYLGPYRHDPAYGHLVVKETVYPCPTCKPKQFLKWENGCYRRDHYAPDCEMCSHAE